MSQEGGLKPHPPVFIGGWWVMPEPKPLVETPRCTMKPACQKFGCWYCNVASGGVDWWQRTPLGHPIGRKRRRR